MDDKAYIAMKKIPYDVIQIGKKSNQNSYIKFLNNKITLICVNDVIRNLISRQYRLCQKWLRPILFT